MKNILKFSMRSCVLGFTGSALFFALPARADLEVDLSVPPRVSAEEGTKATATPNPDGTGQILRVEYPNNEGRANFAFTTEPFDGPLTAISFTVKGEFGFARIGVRSEEPSVSVGRNIPATAAGSEKTTLDFAKPSVDADGRDIAIGYPITRVTISFRYKDLPADEFEITNLVLHGGN